MTPHSIFFRLSGTDCKLVRGLGICCLLLAASCTSGVITVSVTPRSVSLPPLAVQHFTAQVSGIQPGVVWSVNGVAGGASVTGTISAGGDYTAPAIPPPSGGVTVKATSQADGTRSDSASIDVSYAVPALTGIAPVAFLAGADRTNLFITGSGFSPQSVLSLNGEALGTFFDSVTQVNVVIPAWPQAGTYRITVANPTPGGGQSNALTFTVCNGPGVDGGVASVQECGRTLDAGPSDAGLLDGGPDLADAGVDAGTPAGPDAGTPAGPDAGTPAGPDAGTPAGPDAGTPAGPDAGREDAGPGDAGIVAVIPDAGPLIVSTIAGNGFLDEDGSVYESGETAELLLPAGVAVDGAGNVYFSDGNNRIRKIDTMNNVTTLAGNGIAGFQDGPGGFNGIAEFSSPGGIALDASGNIYVADTGNNRIRKVDTAGNVTTIAGNGTAGLVDETGAPGSAEFSGPRAVALDASGNLYVADTGNARIRLIDTAGDVTTFAGSTDGYLDGSVTLARFQEPSGIALDARGSVYVADSGNNRIRKIDSTRNVTTYAGNGGMFLTNGTGGADGTATFWYPWGLAVDTSGNVLVGDSNNQCVRKIDTSGNVTTVAGDGTSAFLDGAENEALFFNPWQVAVNAHGDIYVADHNNNRIREIGGGFVSTAAGNGSVAYEDGTGGPDGTASFNAPSDVAVDANGNCYVADTNNNRIRMIDAMGNVTTFAGNGVTGGLVDGTGGARGTAEFDAPTGVAVVPVAGFVYVADSYNNAVRVIDTQGNVSTVAGNGNPGDVDGNGGIFGIARFNNPTGIALNAQGNILVADTGNYRIRLIHYTSGVVTTIAGNGRQGYLDGPGLSAEFNNPTGIAVDSQGYLYVADGNRVRKIDLQGNVTTLAGNGTRGDMDGTGGPNGTAELNQVSSVAVDANGYVSVADLGNNRVRWIDPAGYVVTLAGNGTAGFEDGTGGSATFNGPAGVSVDALGNIYVADSNNGRIRKITLAGSMDAGNMDAGVSDAGNMDAGASDAGNMDAGSREGSGVDAGSCRCSTSSGCSGPSNNGLSCPSGTICNAGELSDAGVATGACVPPQYTVNEGAGTVTDNVTGLGWQQIAPTTQPAACQSDGTGGVCTWADAQTYCSELSLGGFSTGWRLPSLPELFSILELEIDSLDIDPAAFPYLETFSGWTSTLYAPGYAWSVYFNFGLTDYNVAAGSYAVRCVR